MTNLKLSLISLVLMLASGCSTAEWRQAGYNASRSMQAFGDSISQPNKTPDPVNCYTTMYGSFASTNCQ